MDNTNRNDSNVDKDGSNKERDWTQGSVLTNLFQLSWPMIISQTLNMIGPTVDMIWVGRLGATAIAGVGVSGMAVMMANSIMMGLGTGARAIIARSIGSNDERGAIHASQQSLLICVGYTLIVAPTGILLAGPILTLLGVEPDVITEGTTYMQIMFIGAVFMSFRMMTEGIMQASGDSVTPMKIAVVFRVIHVILCPFLIFGWWIFPRLGVQGAALTNVISQAIGLILGMWVLFTGKTRMKLTLSHFGIDVYVIWRMVRIGIPAAIMGMQRSFGNLVLMWFIVPYGTVAVAAHTLCQRVEMFVMMIGMGWGRGAGVLVGQNLGAKKPGRAEKSGWLASGTVEVLTVGCAIAILIWPEAIINIFGPDPEVVATASVFIRITAVGFLLFGLEPVLMQSLSGAGDTLPPMLATTLSFWVIQIPLAWLFPGVTNMGVYGIRWAMVIGRITNALALVIYFKTGRWKQKKV